MAKVYRRRGWAIVMTAVMTARKRKKTYTETPCQRGYTVFAVPSQALLVSYPHHFMFAALKEIQPKALQATRDAIKRSERVIFLPPILKDPPEVSYVLFVPYSG